MQLGCYGRPSADGHHRGVGHGKPDLIPDFRKGLACLFVLRFLASRNHVEWVRKHGCLPSLQGETLNIETSMASSRFRPREMSD
jgi:hypothetical protein